MPKKLNVTADLCDLRQVREETLAAYASVTITADLALLNERAKQLIARYPVTLHCDTVLDTGSAQMCIVNGQAEITGDNAPAEPTLLIVNGELKIAADAADALRQYPRIIVNGMVRCPRSAAALLGNVTLNGQMETWPDGAVLLKRTAVLDRTFALRAKPALYWAARRVVLLDGALDLAALAAKGARFAAPQAIVAESLAERAVPLFGEETDFVVVPDGTAFFQDDAELTPALLRRRGVKLYVQGDLRLSDESAPLLPRLEYCRVTGTVLLPAALEPALDESCVECGDTQIVRGALLEGQGSVTVGRWALEHGDGLCLRDCGSVTLDEDLEPELIAQKLTIVDCGMVTCTPAQKDAVQRIALEVGQISTSQTGLPAAAADASDTVRIVADSYTL